MVVTTNMGEFISNIRNERMNQFWNDTKKFQKFSPTTEEMVENAPPGTFDDAEEELISAVQRHEDTSWGKKRGHYDKGDFDSEELAIEYAIRNKYKQILRSPLGTKYWFRHPRNGHKSYEDIINGHYYLKDCTTWIIKYCPK